MPPFADAADPGDLARLAADLGPDLLAVVDPEGVVRWASRSAVRLLGFDPAEGTGRPLLDFVHPEDQATAVGAILEATRRDGSHQVVRVRALTAAGDWVTCEVSGESTESDTGRWLVLSVRPVEGRSALVERRDRISRLIQQSSIRCARARWDEVDATVGSVLAELADVIGADAVELAWDEDGSGMRTGVAWHRGPAGSPGHRRSPFFESLFGMAALGSELLCCSSDLRSLAPCPTRDLLERAGTVAVVEARVGDEPVAVVRISFEHSWSRWDDANIDLVSLLVAGLLSTLRRGRAEEALQERARRDPLTGLLNRAELIRILETRLAARGRGAKFLGVLYGDLDGFKEVNDGLGHAAGDRLLLAVAAALRTHTRDGDAVARFGGDEFVVVCPDLDDADQLCRVAERVEGEVRRLGPDGIAVGISFGCAVVGPDADVDADELLHRADEAMYRHKRGRRPTRARPAPSSLR